MSSKVGYFVMNQMTGQRGWTSEETRLFFDHIQALQPSVMLFMDDDGKALQTKALLPDCAVLVRAYRDEARVKEGELWQKKTPQVIFDEYRHTDPRLIRNIGNEPNSYISDDDLRKMATWYAQVMDLFGSAGIAIAVPGFGEGHPDVDRLAALEPLWIAFDKWHDLHIYNTHEYGTWRGMLFNEGGKWDVTPWRVGRFETFVVPYLNKTGHKIPRVIIGEFGCDSAHDGTSNRGWKSAWDEKRYADEIKAAVDRFYHKPHYIGLTIFSWGNTGKPFTEDDWTTFDVSTASALQTRLVAMADNPPAPPPFDYGTLEPRRIEFTGLKLIDYINLRAQPSDGSPILAHLPNHTDVHISKSAQTINGFAWYKVQFGIVTGYVAETGSFKVVPIPEPPPPNALDKAALLALVSDVQNALDKLKDALK